MPVPSALLMTELYVPPVFHGAVMSPSPLDCLDEGLTRKLTLDSAPVGSGKTTLLNEWFTEPTGVHPGGNDMTYPAAAVGAAIGMMLALVVFSNSWRFGFLPKGYDFIHEFGKSFVRSDHKLITYTVRFVLGIIFHPVLFVFVWGREGVLGIYPFRSDVLSAVLMVVIEASGFAFLLSRGIFAALPKELVGKVIVLQFVIHLILGILMGLSYEILT
jgi:hypothetical protein